jgi:agmatine deiminase
MPRLKILDKTPAALGYTFPAEWVRQEATWFSWPRPEGISFPGKYHTVPGAVAAIMRQITPRQWVYVNVPNENYERIVREQLIYNDVNVRRVKFFHIKTNENWARDHGPAFVVKKARSHGGAKARSAGGTRAVVDWGFNAWGGKYPPYDSDDAVPTEIARTFNLPVFYPRMPKRAGGVRFADHVPPRDLVVMEGGAVEFNGAGTVLTTTDCLLNKNRNPDLSKAQIEHYLKEYYGQDHVCWLTGGIEGDDTDGHVDDLARFISPTKIVMAIEPDPRDANYRVLKSARKQVEKLRDQDGRPFEIVEIPMPGPVEHDGQRLPATYVNFLFVNGACLVPTFGPKKTDQKALDVLQSHLPKHKVIGIDCRELIWGLGAIHCLTQQMPAV